MPKPDDDDDDEAAAGASGAVERPGKLEGCGGVGLGGLGDNNERCTWRCVSASNCRPPPPAPPPPPPAEEEGVPTAPAVATLALLSSSSSSSKKFWTKAVEVPREKRLLLPAPLSTAGAGRSVDDDDDVSRATTAALFLLWSLPLLSSPAPCPAVPPAVRLKDCERRGRPFLLALGADMPGPAERGTRGRPSLVVMLVLLLL